MGQEEYLEFFHARDDIQKIIPSENDRQKLFFYSYVPRPHSEG